MTEVKQIIVKQSPLLTVCSSLIICTIYLKGFLQLLAQLTEVGNVSREQFLSKFSKIQGIYLLKVIVRI